MFCDIWYREAGGTPFKLYFDELIISNRQREGFIWMRTFVPWTAFTKKQKTKKKVSGGKRCTFTCCNSVIVMKCYDRWSFCVQKYNM